MHTYRVKFSDCIKTFKDICHKPGFICAYYYCSKFNYQNTDCGILAFKVTKYKVTYIQHSLEISCESLCKYLMPFGSYL